MARLIGTAGHVDHGKTTLIQALTGIDADRLPEEKARGMTIDIGFAYADLPNIGRVSIVDVPGHERFLTNMLVGALGIDVALLVVAADESVMPQTREHFQILELLPVQKMVVAMTRADLADDDTRAIARTEIEELLEPTRFKGSPILEVASPSGQGIPELKEALAAALQAPDEAEPGTWYLPIDRVFTVKGHGCVVTGTLARGKVAEGQKAYLEPDHREVRIRSIQSHGTDAKEGEKGRRTALNLVGVKTEEVHRGMAVGEPGALFSTNILDARVRWISPSKHGLRVRVSVGAAEGIGKVFLNDEEPDLVQLRLEAPLACALQQPLIIRRYSPPDVLAGGRIVVPNAKPRRKSEKATTASGQTDEDAILSLLEGSRNGLPTEEICRLLGKSPQALGGVFEQLLKEKQAFGFAGQWFAPTAFTAGVKAFLQALKEIHEAKPMQALQPREKVTERAKLEWRGKPLDRILAALAATGKLRVEGTAVRLPEFKIALSDKQRAFLDRVVAALDQGGINPPGVMDLASQLHVPHQAVEEILRLGVEAGEVSRVAEGIFFSPSELEKVKAKVREIGSKGPFTAAQFRDAAGTTRKFAIPLLEHFDSIRLTVRVGDLRALAG